LKRIGGRGVEAADRLNEKARDYEVLAASHAERAPLDVAGQHEAAATAFTVVAIVLREVACSLDEAA
jgi:hypothetical protein